ncbi:MAG: hypothetical protein ABID38_02595 [Candidatus Diapherotrites archaeon]
MGLLKLETIESIERNYNYAHSPAKKCMSCRGPIESTGNIYARRFCSEKCKQDYLLE